MNEALIKMGLSPAQIQYINNKLSLGKNVYVEQLKDGRYYRMTVVDGAFRNGFQVCPTYYFEMILKYKRHIPTVEAIIDLTQEAGYQESIEERSLRIKAKTLLRMEEIKELCQN